jgi:uncharacterized membrane protein YidH (DUF202 family)
MFQAINHYLNMNEEIEKRRKAARRTAIGLLVFAIAIFVAFYYSNIA